MSCEHKNPTRTNTGYECSDCGAALNIKPPTALWMIEWVSEHVPPKYRPDQGALEACLWFLANNEAEQVREFNQREMAHYIQAGFEGFKTKIDLMVWAREYEGTRDDLIREMKAFWLEDLPA